MKNKILAVDDSRLTCQIIKDTLEGEKDIELTVAFNGLEGLKKLKEDRYDLIITGIVMPVIDGFEMIKEIKAHKEWSDIPIIILTSKREADKTVEGLSLRTNDYLAKSFDKKELLTRIKAQLKIKNLQTELLKTNQQLREANLELQSLAVTDELTRLFNHRFFHERLGEELSRAERHKYTVSLIMIDIDNFKDFNDSYGHLEGDKVLKRVADVFNELKRRSDICARYGGEEFGLILPETDLEGARLMAERIRKRIEKIKLKVDEVRVQLTISAGVASFDFKKIGKIDTDRNYKDDLIMSADKALYQSKANGKNSVSVYS